MPQFMEKRTISISSLMNLCIEHHWFDRATNEQYDKFLDKWSSLNNLNTIALYRIARDIRLYSSIKSVKEYMDEDIMFAINLACHHMFVRVD